MVGRGDQEGVLISPLRSSLGLRFLPTMPLCWALLPWNQPAVDKPLCRLSRNKTLL